MTTGINRSERRRLERLLKQQNVTYTFTNEQLQERDAQRRKEMGKEMEDRFIKIFFSMCLMVGHKNYGWTGEQCWQFGEDICKEYETEFGNPTTETINKYVEKACKLTGVRFER